MDIAVVGSTNVDLVTYIDRMPVPGETLPARDFALGCGGKGANQAVAATRLGSEVLFVTRIGNDPFAELSLRNFLENGIETHFVSRTDTTSGVAPILVGPDGENSILIVAGANAHLSVADIDRAAEAIARCRLLVLQLEIPLETVYRAVQLGAEAGIPVLLNPAPVPPELDLERIANVDYLVPNVGELQALTRLRRGRPVGQDSGHEVEASAGALLACGIANVIVTLGGEGVLWVNDDHSVRFPARSVEPVDTTGAGDAFIGCLAHCLVHTGDVRRSIELATAYAADSVTRRGTQTAYATAADFRARTGFALPWPTRSS
ncbi:ribokinase [Granulicoccus sp. GXG6511]|uniref:ribokinase n=1 Tax=Granulicoccus sp. GXG6511 TaxID=3381351 RepID=UPI003D7D2DDB